MDQKSLIEFLISTGHMSALEATAIADHFTLKELERHQFFLKEGRVCKEYLFLASGFMRSFAMDTNGNEITTNFHAPNQVVFEVASFFNQAPAKENIQALEDCSGWVISFDQLNRLFHSMPAFREFGRHILVRGFAGLKNRMLSMITDTAEVRYTKLLDNSPAIFQQASLKHIASYLGITDTSLSRIRKEISKNRPPS